MLHKIKVLDSFADAILCGDKPFEIRENDRGYQKGDLVKFVVVDKLGLTVPHLLDHQRYEITYVISGWGLKNGYVVFGIKPVESEVKNGL